MLGKTLELVTNELGCIVSTSHKLNKDGYLRVSDVFEVSNSAACRWIREWKRRD